VAPYWSVDYPDCEWKDGKVTPGETKVSKIQMMAKTEETAGKHKGQVNTGQEVRINSK
jgi:hypothetical protein